MRRGLGTIAVAGKTPSLAQHINTQSTNWIYKARSSSKYLSIDKPCYYTTMSNTNAIR